MIYDPITRQRVELIGRYPEQTHCFRFGKRIKATEGTSFRFAKVRYVEERKGGFEVGTERDCDINRLVADDGAREIHKVYESLPELD